MLRQKNSLLESHSCRLTGIWLFIFLISQFGYSQDANVQSLPPAAALELGKPIEREITGEQKHGYQISLSANQYIQVTIEQRGIDVVARLSGADGKLLLSYDTDARPSGTEKIEFVAPGEGVYRLDVEAVYKLLPAGKYEIRLTEQRAASEKEKSLQEARQFYDESLNMRRAGKAAAALPIITRALEISEKNLDADDPEIARYLNLLGNLYSDTSDYEKAEAAYQRALAIRTKVFGEMNPSVALTLSDLGVIYRLGGEPERAEPLYRRALAIREQTLGKEHPEVSRTLQNLGNLKLDAGDYVEAEKIYLQSLAIREKTVKPNDPMMSSIANVLAVTYGELGDFVKAEAMYRRALEISEKNLPPEHPTIAIYLDNLGGIYYDLGDYARAEPMLRRALEIREKALGPDDLMVSASLINIGNLYTKKSEYAEAEKSYLRSLDIREKKYKGNPHPWIVQSLYNLGDLFRTQGDFEKAGSYMQRALEVAEKLPGANNPSLTYALTGLAAVYQEKGEFEKAEPLYRRILIIYDTTLGAGHATKAKILTALAALYLAKGDLPAAIAAQKEANDIVEKQITLNLAIGSEQKKLGYLASLSKMLDRTLTISFYAKDNEEAGKMALTNLLQRKGRVLDEMSDTLSALRQRFNQEDRNILDKLNESNAKLALLVLNEPRGETLAEHQKQVLALEEKRDNLEIEISRRAAGFYQTSKPITLEAVRQDIPENAVLLEFAVYQPYLPQEKNKLTQVGAPRYSAYVVGRQGEVRMKDLGQASEIDAAVKEFREALLNSESKNVMQVARKLDEKIMKPLRGIIGDKKQLLISPDGLLNLIPFEALVDEQNHYLVENYAFSYLTSGRDLLRMQAARESKSSLLVIANPLFGEPGAEQIAQAKRNARGNKRRSVTATRNLSDTYFAPLGGTSQEARSIQMLFPEVVSLSGAQATESALKKAIAPRILHIATHGFFLEDIADLTNNSRQTEAGNNNGSVKTENPLLRSGLALAGANHRGNGSGGDDGILTALEASGLNLWGTKLVVLSACDTGIGEVKNGEGVYGLRRAFVLAGAESLVMSLWSVSDSETRKLMTNYYKNLKQGMGRGESLREVQLEMLKRNGQQHPFYWAGFIQSGEWANLDGKR